MNIIKRILLALVGAVVGFVVGLIIGVLGELVGLPRDSGPIVSGLSALAGGYLAFIGAVPMKVLFSLASIIVALCAVALCALAILTPTPESLALEYPPLTTIEVRQMLEKCSCGPEIQAEVDSLLSRFGEKFQSLYGEEDFSTAPALARFGKTLSNPTWATVPRDYFEIGMPTYLRLRFGQHFHYQYILFFRTGTDASLIMSPSYEHVTGNIYFKPGKPYVRKH